MEEKTQELQTQPLVHSFNKTNFSVKYPPKIIALFLVLVLAGITTGYLLSSNSSSNKSLSNTASNIDLSSAPKGTVVGSNDTNTFKDTVQGVLKEGGSNGEGAFHLERPGGDSQNVYLTSSSVDLSKFIGKKIKVWGQTQKPQHVGWLMDVGRVEVL